MAMKTENVSHIVFLASLISLSIILILHLPAHAAEKESRESPVSYYKIKFIYDGDTLLLEDGKKIRFLGINAPEIDHKGVESEFLAKASRRFLRTILKGHQVRLEYDTERQDRYGRLLAYVFLKDGKMVNELIVRKGLAHVMFNRKNLKYKNVLLENQRKAMKKKIGIWGHSVKEKEKHYVGNKNSFRFHRPGCHFGRKISKKNRMRFKSRPDAFWEGHSPCKQCGP